MSALHPRAVAHVSRHSPTSMARSPRQRRAVRVVLPRCRADADATHDDAQDASPPSRFYTLYTASTSSSTAASPSSSPPSPSQSRPPPPQSRLVNGQPLTLREVRAEFPALDIDDATRRAETETDHGDVDGDAAAWALFENAGGSQVPAVVADAVRHHMLYSYAQLGAGYPHSDRATVR